MPSPAEFISQWLDAQPEGALIRSLDLRCMVSGNQASRELARLARCGPSISASKSSRSAVCPSGCWCWTTASPAISSEPLNGSARTSLNTRLASWPGVSGRATGTTCSKPERTCRRGWWRQSRTAFPHRRLFLFVGRYRQVPTFCNVAAPAAVWTSQISSPLNVRSPQARTARAVC